MFSRGRTESRIPSFYLSSWRKTSSKLGTVRGCCRSWICCSQRTSIEQVWVFLKTWWCTRHRAVYSFSWTCLSVPLSQRRGLASEPMPSWFIFLPWAHSTSHPHILLFHYEFSLNLSGAHLEFQRIEKSKSSASRIEWIRRSLDQFYSICEAGPARYLMRL